jgi:hypothetical protein
MSEFRILPCLRRLALLLCLPWLAGCDQLVAQLGLPDPQREAAAALAEGKAIGSACRHSGRALEDCYTLNPAASKAAVFAGWREMNDYMTQNNLEVVPSRLPAAAQLQPTAEERAEAGHPSAARETAAVEESPRRRLRRGETPS